MTFDRSMAQRYEAARRTSDATMALWMDAVAERVPPGQVSLAIDLGCGTGRLTAALADRRDPALGDSA